VGRINHPSDLLTAGQKIKVKVLQFERQNQRVSLGLKQTTPDPWENVAATFPVGRPGQRESHLHHRLRSLCPAPGGVEGLVHVSEMAWTKRVRHPSKILSAGDEVEVMVLDVDSSQKRVSLGLKQTSPNPWIRLPNATRWGPRSRAGSRISPISVSSSASTKGSTAGPYFRYFLDPTPETSFGDVQEGQEVQAIVLSIDRENQRFSWDQADPEKPLG